MLEKPGEIHRLMEFCSKVSGKMSEYLIEEGCDLIALVDPMTSQIDPLSFAEFVSPYVTHVFDQIRTRKVFSSFFVCGHAQQNIEVMCQCHPDNISIDENIPLEFVRDVTSKYNISFGGNLKLTMVLLHGSVEEVQREAMECMDTAGNKGFILSPGCDLPYDTPPDNLRAIRQLIVDPYRQEIIRAMDQKPDGMERLNMRDYGISDKVIVDIITLDSESCAPCQYMVEAVKKMAPHFEGIVEWREHPIKKMEGISFMSSLMVKNIPTICIDGKITFVSKIPPQQELMAAVQKRINEKLKLKIKSRKGEILVIGSDQEDFTEILKRLNKALEETGREILIRQSMDPNVKATFGIIKTPAIILTEFRLKSEGELPSVEVIKEWFKSI
jgi:uroporphyrinogen decarboxylase